MARTAAFSITRGDTRLACCCAPRRITPCERISAATISIWGLVADPAQIERILENLLVNAIRHFHASAQVVLCAGAPDTPEIAREITQVAHFGSAPKVKKLLVEGSWPVGYKPTLLAVSNDAGLNVTKLAESIALTLGAADIPITVRGDAGSGPRPSLQAGDYDILLTEAVVTGGDPHLFLFPLSTSEGVAKGPRSLNFSFYRNPRLDDALVTALREHEPPAPCARTLEQPVEDQAAARNPRICRASAGVAGRRPKRSPVGSRLNGSTLQVPCCRLRSVTRLSRPFSRRVRLSMPLCAIFSRMRSTS